MYTSPMEEQQLTKKVTDPERSLSEPESSQSRKLTRREKRELAKETKREVREKGDRARSIKKLFIWFLTAGIVIFAGFKAWKWVTAPTPEVAGETTEVSEGDWVKGNKEAKVILVEYGDFQCPACANFEPVLREELSKNGDKMRFVYRHFPLPQHKNAISSALAAEAAGIQGKFWEMHDMLYDKQVDWENASNAKDIFTGYAKDLGLDENKFKDDFEKEELKSKIQSNKVDGERLGINSTPTFYLNGVKIQPRNYEEFKNLVDGQIKRV